MNDDCVISNERLKEITGYTRDHDLEKHLVSMGIACFRGRNGVWTTSSLIKEAGMIQMGYSAPFRLPEKRL